MKIWAWGTVVFSALSLAAVACGGSGGGGGSGNGGGNTSSSSSSGTTSSSSGTTSSSSGTTSSSSGTTSSSSGSTSSSSGSMGCGSLQWSTDATCQGCAETNCCTELAACDTGTDCGALLDCLTACTSGDTTCQNDCLTNNSAGQSDAQALVACMGTSTMQGACNTDCSSGQICDSGLQTTSNPMCGDCLGASCCAEFDACVADTTCKACITGAQTTGCDTNALFNAANACSDTKCGDTCGAPICDSGFKISPLACATCLSNNCCTELTTCNQDQTCADCITGASTTGCTTNANLTAANNCFSSKCGTECM